MMTLSAFGCAVSRVAPVLAYMFSKYDQGSLLSSQLCDESRIECKLEDVSLIAGVEKDGAVSFLPVLIWHRRKTEHNK